MYPRYYGGFGASGPFSSYGSYGNYGGYGGLSSYGGYRPYGSYGGYGLSGNQYGRDGSQFVRQAEDRTRPAFQSVESVVGAVGSIAMMLDSTYMAIHTCFRAILGVVDHFSSMRAHVWEIISAFTLLRWLRNIVRGLLNLLRQNRQSANESAWQTLSQGVQGTPEAIQASGTSVTRSANVWPTVTFFAAVIGIPWLLWRIISGIARTDHTEQNSVSWLGDPAAVQCVTLYQYTAQRGDEMSFDAGQELILAPPNLQPRIQGWALAGNADAQGLIPQNYIQPLPPAGQRGVSDTPLS